MKVNFSDDTNRELVNALTSLAQNQVTVFDSTIPLLDALDSKDKYIKQNSQKILEIHTKNLQACIKSDLGQFKPTIHFRGYSNTSSIFFLTERLISRAKKTNPTEALSWITNFLNTKEAECFFIMALWDFKVTAPVHLVNDFWLYPISELPQSINKENLDKEVAELVPMVAGMVLYPPIKAAIVAKKNIPLFAHDPKASAPIEPEEIFDELDTLRCLLTCLGPRQTIVFKTWLSFSNNDLEEGNFLNGNTIFRPELQAIDIGWGDLDENLAINIIAHYFQMNEHDRRILELAAFRLNRALTRPGLADAAIEIAIAIEILLTTNDNTPSEITHRLRTRAARFLGGNKTERQKTFDIVNNVYTARSGVVHMGNLPQKPKPPSDTWQKSLWDAAKVCSQIMQKIILSGEIPNWKEFDISNINI